MQYRAIYPSIDPKKNKFHIFSIFFSSIRSIEGKEGYRYRSRGQAEPSLTTSHQKPTAIPLHTPFSQVSSTSPIFQNLVESTLVGPSTRNQTNFDPFSFLFSRTGEISRVSTLFTPRIQPNPIDRRPKNRSLHLLRIEEAYLKKSLSIQLSSFSLSTIGQLELTRYNFQCPARYILDFTFTNNMRQPPACTHRERERERGEFPRLDNPGHTHA